ncbi:MAG: hypothetical protein K2X03_23100 [Bryobacteraceae bacterium]|nr:hypothetical protein [Bryobacteraceae bacterium]
MQRIQVYLKVVVEADDDERTEKLATEMQRMLKRIHGVREVEITNFTSESFDEPEEDQT